MKIKVFYIADWFNTIQENLLNNLDRDMDVTLILTDKFPKYKPGKYNVKIFKTRDMISAFSRSKKTHEYFLVYEKALFEYIKKEKPNIIVCNLWYKFSTIQMAKYCKKNKIPFILQTEMQRYPKSIMGKAYAYAGLKAFKDIFKNAKYILPWTKGSYNFFLKQKCVKDKNKLIIISPGINIEKFHKVKVRKKNPHTLKILCIGRFLEYKRHEDLIKALKYIKDSKKIDLKLDIIGKGFTTASSLSVVERKIEKLIEKNKLSKEVQILEGVPYEEITRVYCEHDILVLPSYNEAIGLVIPEAMACGLPVIVSDSAGASTYVENEKNGYIFETFNYKDLADKIIRLNNPDKRKKMGEEAEKHIKKNFEAKITGKKFSEIIKKALK
jgi:glycosyltransferase involved in cell wall biosynthesis